MGKGNQERERERERERECVLGKEGRGGKQNQSLSHPLFGMRKT